MKEKRLLESLNLINEKYIKEAEPKMKTTTSASSSAFIRIACLILVAVLSIYLFVPIKDKGPNVSKYEDSDYYPLIASIADYRYVPSPYKNNFQRLSSSVKNFFGGFKAVDKDNAAPESGGDTMAPAPEKGYVEVTDNQVEGVIEADIVKRTGTHIFRLGYSGLSIYTIDKENTELVTSFTLPKFDGDIGNNPLKAEMYLSADGNTVTVIKNYYSKNYTPNVGIISIDVSDFDNVKVKKQISVDGRYNSSRMVDGKLLLITEHYVREAEIDYDKPETYVPTITEDGVTSSIKFEDIIYPEKLSNMRYSVVAMMDEDTLDITGTNALLCFNGEIYVSYDNVYLTRAYSGEFPIEGSDTIVRKTMTDIAVIGYSGDTLENKGILSVEGSIKDQYSMDEYEGHLRVVTSTFENAFTTSGVSAIPLRSASLTVFDLSKFAKIAEVKNFAPEGEEAASVRFDKDKAYVCTAIVITFTDPVYFFDLSDYSNITYTDTGVIDGYSTSLIQLKDGFLLGIGPDDGMTNKVEVYEEVDGKVVSVDKYTFNGGYSDEYKAYLIDRENYLFGFGVSRMQYMVEDEYYGSYPAHYDTYVLLTFNGIELVEVLKVKTDFINSVERVRAFVDDGYIYITNDSNIEVFKITE